MTTADFRDNVTEYLITEVYKNTEDDYYVYYLNYIWKPDINLTQSGCYHTEKELVLADITKILLANFKTKEPLIEKILMFF